MTKPVGQGLWPLSMAEKHDDLVAVKPVLESELHNEINAF